MAGRTVCNLEVVDVEGVQVALGSPRLRQGCDAGVREVVGLGAAYTPPQRCMVNGLISLRSLVGWAKLQEQKERRWD